MASLPRYIAGALALALIACGDDGGDTGPDAAPPADADLTCEPLSQSGCSDEQKCAFVLQDADARDGFVACADDGSAGIGEACTAPSEAGESDDCASGGHCYNGACHAMCEFGVVACETGTCARFANLEFDLCLDSCDPLDQDCPDTAGGSPQGCYLTQGGPVCAAVFGETGVPPGGQCNFTNDCAKGSGCFGGSPGVCLAYCDIQLCAPSGGDWSPCPEYCAADEVCQGISGEAEVGACVPDGL